MPADNVYPCPHCGGTGEHRPTTGEPRYRICAQLQDGREYHGNYSYAEAVAELERLKAMPWYGMDPGHYTMEEIRDANL